MKIYSACWKNLALRPNLPAGDLALTEFDAVIDKHALALHF